jgi:hypothetical protein
MSLLPGEIEDFHAGCAGGLHTFRVGCDSAGGFFIITFFNDHDLGALALDRLLGLEFHLCLDLCCRTILLRSTHAANELASFPWREIFRVLVLEWEQWAGFFDDTLDLKVP